MNIEMQAVQQTTGQSPASVMSQGAESIKRGREAAQNASADAADTANEKAIQPEELLQNIKALTEDGAYSVRFEMNDETSDVVINLVEQETGEVIRQIPPEEIVNMRQSLTELRGNIVEISS